MTTTQLEALAQPIEAHHDRTDRRARIKVRRAKDARRSKGGVK